MRTIKRVLLCSCALLAVCLSAHAADLPAKTPAAATVISPVPAGWTIGIGAETDVANATLASQGAGTNLYAAGAGVVGVVRYTWLMPNAGFVKWADWEAGFTYQNLGGSQACAGTPCAMSSNWDLETGFSISFPWTSATAIFQNLAQLIGWTSPQSLLPPNVSVSSMQPYIGGWAHFTDVSATVNAATGTDWQASPSIGAGIKAPLTTGGLLNVRVEESFPNTGFSIGPGNTAKQGYVTRLKGTFEF